MYSSRNSVNVLVIALCNLAIRKLNGVNSPTVTYACKVNLKIIARVITSITHAPLAFKVFIRILYWPP